MNLRLGSRTLDLTVDHPLSSTLTLMAKHPHLDAPDFADLLAGRLSKHDAEAKHLHLLGCRQCQLGLFEHDELRARRYIARYHGKGSGQAWRQALERPELENPPFDHSNAWAADEVLLTWQPQSWPLRMTNDPRFQSPDVLMFLLERARRWWQDTPAKSEHLATGAVWILEAADWCPESLRANLLARAYAYQANANRIMDRFDEAHKGFREANRWYAKAAGKKNLAGEILWLRGALASTEGYTDLAIRTLKSACKLLPRFCGPTTQLDVSISLAHAYAQSGRLTDATEMLENLLEIYLPGDFREGLYLSTLQNLALNHARLGRLAEAKARLPEIQYLAKQEGKRLNLLRVNWFEAEIYKAELEASVYSFDGHLSKDQGLLAAIRFREVQAGFKSEGLHVDAALAGLSLAEMYLEIADPPAAIGVAQEVIPVFRAKGLRREATVAELIAAQAL